MGRWTKYLEGKMILKPRFEKLLEPYQLGQVKTRNRIVKPAQGMGLATEEGYVSDRNDGYYEALAKGGVGLIIVELTCVDFPMGAVAEHCQLLIDNDKFIPGLSKLAQLIHSYGCPTFLQLGHAGPSHLKAVSGNLPVSSSALSLNELPRTYYGPTYDLSISEIGDLVTKFANAAERAKKAGFDGVEIHAAHGYLVNSFLSRAWNKRQDAYGGDLRNRCRFAVEIIQAIKERLGRGFPVGIRINGAEYGVEKGTTSEDSQGMARILEKAGANHINVSAYGYHDYARVVQPEQVFYPEPPRPLAAGIDKSHNGAGALVPLAAAIKKVTSIPIIGVGRLDPILSERILRQGKVDLVALARCLMADPELPNKVASGRFDDVAPCTACLTCWEQVHFGKPVRCRVNTAIGREREYVIKPAERKKRVMVVGGGPAGMEVARVAALRGHQVVLFEKEHKLGGLTRIAALVKGTEIEDLPALIRYFKTQIIKLGVKIRLGKEVNEALIEEIKPDVVVLAVGGVPVLPKISGINRRNVVSTAALYRKLQIYLNFFSPSVLRWLTKFWMPIGKRVLIIGGGIQGCELAEFLVKRGRKVTILETSEELGAEMVMETKERLLSWLHMKGVTMLTGVKYEEITDKGLILITKEGETQTIEADTIVPAICLRPNSELLKIVERKTAEIYLVGDCREPHLILEAVSDGSRIARLI
jgi:2,4-dienoyl-CoA reductase (NADPH2)